MKNKTSTLVLIIFILLLSSFSVQGQIKKSFRGVWDVFVPDGPEDYDIFVVTITKDSTFAKYPNDPNVYPSKSVNYKNDTLIYEYNPAGIVDLTTTLTMKNKTTLTGKFAYESGDFDCTFTKKQTKKTKKKKL
jgi:hypothetical protein